MGASGRIESSIIATIVNITTANIIVLLNPPNLFGFKYFLCMAIIN